MQSRILPLLLALAAFTTNAADSIEVYFSPKRGEKELVLTGRSSSRSPAFQSAMRVSKEGLA